MNKRENWYRLLTNDNPGWISTPWEAFDGNYFGNAFILEPISTAVKGDQKPGTFLDQWGVTWMLPEDHKFPNPYVTAENKAIKNIKNWENELILPPLGGHDWTSAKQKADSVNREDSIACCMVVGGLFERTHYLMGFEDALINYMLEPEAMSALIGAITDWKIEHLRQIIENLNPDVILFHDDWGNKDNLFMQPDVWRSVIKPHQQKIVDFVKSKKVTYLHHSDSICEPIVEDMADMGIEGWQGVIPQNDILSIQQKLNGRMALIGGIDAQVIDMPEADEALIRQEVRNCIDTYCPAGSFIPCIPNIQPMHADVAEIYNDELETYGRSFMEKR